MSVDIKALQLCDYEGKQKNSTSKEKLKANEKKVLGSEDSKLPKASDKSEEDLQEELRDIFYVKKSSIEQILVTKRKGKYFKKKMI